MVELLTSALFGAIASRFGISLQALAGLLLASALVAITFIDIDIWEIPDEISLPGIALGGALRPFAFDTPWYEGLAGAALGGSFLWLVRWAYFAIRKTEGMGLGDVKLIAMIGAFLGPFALVPVILVASVTGSVVGCVALAVGRRKRIAAGPPAKAEPPTDPDRGTAPAGPAIDVPGIEEAWVPPQNAVPFGPFLSIGALVALLYGPAVDGILFRLLR